MSTDNHMQRVYDIYEQAGHAADAVERAARRATTAEERALLRKEEGRLLSLLERIADRYTLPLMDPFTGRRVRLAPWQPDNQAPHT